MAVSSYSFCLVLQQEDVVVSDCCNVAIGWEGYLANAGPQGPIYGQNRQRTASNRLLESHRKQSSNGLQHGRQDEGLAVVVFSVEMDTFSHGYYAGLFSTRRAPSRVGGVCDDEMGVFNDQGKCCRALLWLVAGVPMVNLVTVSQDWRQKGGGRSRSPFSFSPFLKALLVGFWKSCPLGLLLYLSLVVSFNRLPAQLKHSLLGTVTHEQSTT